MFAISRHTLAGKLLLHHEHRLELAGLQSRIEKIKTIASDLFRTLLIPFAVLGDTVVAFLAIPLFFLYPKQHLYHTGVTLLLLLSTPFVMIAYLVSGHFSSLFTLKRSYQLQDERLTLSKMQQLSVNPNTTSEDFAHYSLEDRFAFAQVYLKQVAKQIKSDPRLADIKKDIEKIHEHLTRTEPSLEECVRELFNQAAPPPPPPPTPPPLPESDPTDRRALLLSLANSIRNNIEAPLARLAAMQKSIDANFEIKTTISMAKRSRNCDGLSDFQIVCDSMTRRLLECLHGLYTQMDDQIMEIAPLIRHMGGSYREGRTALINKAVPLFPEVISSLIEEYLIFSPIAR